MWMNFWNIFSFTIGDQKKLLNKNKKTSVYILIDCHTSFFNLKALCILIVVRQKDRQAREHPCHSHTQRMTNKKVNQESKPWGDQQMQNVRTMQEPTK